MARSFTSYNRISIGLAITIVFLLIYVTTEINKNHFETMQNALITLHADKVVEKDFIFEIIVVR